MPGDVYCPILKDNCIKQDLPLRKYSWLLTCNFCYVTEKRQKAAFYEKVTERFLNNP